MKLAVLHWVYKDPALAVNRAQWLRRLNPGVPVYCLYGGPVADAGTFAAALHSHVDDFYAFTEDCTAHEKWLHCDRLLTAWQRDRGHALDWDTLFVAQWDLALLAPIHKLIGSLGPEQVLFSGARPIREVAHFWNWIDPATEQGQAYVAFKADLEARDAFPRDPLCCNLVAAALPRRYLDRYAAQAPRDGFSEYKMPILAQSWGFDFCHDHAFDIRWTHERASTRWQRRLIAMHAEQCEPVHSGLVAAHAALPFGKRAFHPFVRPLPLWALNLPTVQAARLTTRRRAAR